MKLETDGMVAIIQTLQDSGLAVTLLSHKNAVKYNAIPITKTKSSVEPRAIPLQTNAVAQLCHDRYTSSYQVAHSNVRSTSLPPKSPEFPRRHNDVSPSLLSHMQSSQGTVTFINSLRKYPRKPPEKNLSSEFVQQVITYTQAKNCAKTHSKSRKQTKEHVTDKTRSSKGVQTKERDCGMSRTSNIKPMKCRSISPDDCRSSSYNDRYHDRYDYLSPRRYRSKGAEVRYLSDVTRFLRETLRHIYEDQTQTVFQVCPTIQRRYSRHRREHHRDFMERRSSTDSNNMEAQVSVPMVSRGVSCITSCDAMPGTYIATCPPLPKFCCYCRKTLPCNCLERSEEENFQSQLEQAVTSWLEELPVSANDRPENKTLREIMVMDLIDKLKDLYRDVYFEENAKNEIKQCVNNLPMWYPVAKRDHNIFRTQIINNLMNKIRGLSVNTQKYKKEIAKWLDDIDITFNHKDAEGRIVDEDAIKKKLIEKLEVLATNSQSDDDTLESEVVEMLRDFPIKADKDKIEHLAQILAGKIQNLPSKHSNKDNLLLHDAFEKEISEWLQDIPRLRKNSTTQRQIEALSQKLQNLQEQGIDNEEIQEEIQNEINDWLERNANDLDPKTKRNLSQKLMRNLTKSSKDIMSIKPKNYLLEQVLQWLESIPELVESKSENQYRAEQLTQKLQELVIDGQDRSDIENEISNWLGKILRDGGKSLDTYSQNNLVQKLLENINAPLATKDEECLLNNIINTLEDISDLDITFSNTKNMACQLAKKIHDLQSSNGKDTIEDALNDEINDWLSELSKTTGAIITPKYKEKMCKLLSVTTNIPRQRKRWSKQGDFIKNLNDQITQILDESVLNLDKNIKENVRNKINHLVGTNIGAVQYTDADYIKEEIVNILRQEGDITSKKAKRIASEIISKAKTISVPESRDITQNVGRTKSLQDEEDVRDIADKNEIDSKTSNSLSNEALLGETNDKSTGSTDKEKKSRLSDVKTEKKPTEFVGTGREKSAIYYHQPDKIQTIKPVPPIQKQIFIDTAENEISEFTESLLEDTTKTSLKPFKFAAQKLAKRAGDLLSDLNTTSADNEKLINDEVLHYFDKLNIHNGPKQKELAKELVNRLQKIAFLTSTPRSSNAATGNFQREEFQEPTMSAILEENTYNQYKQPHSKEEKQYLSQLSAKIDGWLKKLPIHFDVKGGKYFKETMTRDLANDIVDRQKYLQLNPNVKTSEQEELEHLKYQVFRWLNKLPDVKQLMPSISKTEELMKFLQEVPVPLLITDKAANSTTRDSFAQRTSNLTRIDDEISNWIETIPTHFFTSKDENCHKQMIKQLADNIDEYQKNNTMTETVLDQMIFDWLQNMIAVSEQTLKNKSESLKDCLINKGIVSFLDSSLDQSQITGLEEWFQSLPLKSMLTSTNIKQMESIKKDFTKKIKEILQQYPKNTPHYEAKTKEIIKKYLQLFPIEPSKRKNQTFLKQKVDELFKKIEVSPAEHQSRILSLSDSTNRDDSNPKNGIDVWISNLPMQPGKSRKDVKEIVDEFVTSMKKTYKNKRFDDTNEDLLHKTKMFITKLPLRHNLVTNDVVQVLADKLVELIKFPSKSSNTNATDVLYNDIENWCDSLPIFGDNYHEDIPRSKELKQNIISKLLNKIANLNMKPEIFRDDRLYEDLLNDEIDDLISPLLQTPELKNNMQPIKEILIGKVRQAKQKAFNEMEAHVYKQQLRDAISTTLPSIENITAEEQVPFEIIKDNLADAYINLNYTPDNELKIKYKQKIGDEINKFCNDYLERYPSSPVDPKKLNEDLYMALQRVPHPKDDTIKSQIEQVRIKDQIHEWLNDIALDKQSAAQQLQKNKIVSVLANDLHETEKEKQANPNIDLENRFRQNIMKWTKKLPLKTEAKANLDGEVDKLIERLKSTESIRRFSISQLKQRSTVPQYQIPPSTLAKDDREHLERIRRRKQKSPSPESLCKDVSESPIPADASNQTEMRPQPLTPHVNVNEYNWSSTRGSKVWETQNSLPTQFESPQPSFIDKSYPHSSYQQMPLPYLPREGVFGSPLLDQDSSAVMHRNQDGSLQPVAKQPFFDAQSTQPFVVSPPSRTEALPSYFTPPQYAVPHAPYTPSPQFHPSHSPYVSSLPYQKESPSLQSPITTPLRGPYSHPGISTPVTPQQPSANMNGPQNRYYPSAPQNPYQSTSETTRKQKKTQFYMKSSDMSSTSDPMEEYTQEQQFRRQLRVTRLGSFDNVPPCRRTLSCQSPEMKRPCGSPEMTRHCELPEVKKPCGLSDECEWMQEEYFGVPCPRRRPSKSPLRSADFVIDREDGKPICNCKKRCLGKSFRGKPRGKLAPCLTATSMKQCSKCCGVHCPHPSYLFFQ